MIGYTTVAEADEYVKQHFLSDDPLRESWEYLMPEDKEVLLRKSFEAIDSLAYSGRKSSKGQPNAFPRYPEKEVSECVKAAQIENALALSDTSTTEDAAFYARLNQFGVDSYSIGNLSEHVSAGSWGVGSTTASGVVSSKAVSLLQPYLTGGYSFKGVRS